jgi:alpha-L-rhamnosidase
MKQIYVFAIFLMLTFVLDAKIIPEKLTCEYLKDPLVIDVLNPRLSWINVASENIRGEVQTAWEMEQR